MLVPLLMNLPNQLGFVNAPGAPQHSHAGPDIAALRRRRALRERREEEMIVAAVVAWGVKNG